MAIDVLSILIEENNRLRGLIRDVIAGNWYITDLQEAIGESDDPADSLPPWPCQQLHGGKPPYVYQGLDEHGLCRHPECNQSNDDSRS